MSTCLSYHPILYLISCKSIGCKKPRNKPDVGFKHGQFCWLKAEENNNYASRRVCASSCQKFVLFVSHLSHLMTKPTKWHVRPAKTQISLGIRPVWSESSLSAWRKLGSLATLSRQRRLWTDWVDAQADLSLRWAHSHFVGFVVRRLIYKCFQFLGVGIQFDYQTMCSKRLPLKETKSEL